MGSVTAREQGATQEGVGGEVGKEAGVQSDLRERNASRKGGVAKVGQVGGHRNRREGTAPLEGAFTYVGEAHLGQSDHCEQIAPLEDAIAKAGEAIGQRDHREQFASLEGVFADMGDAGRQRDSRERGAQLECVIADAGDSLWYNQLMHLPS